MLGIKHKIGMLEINDLLYNYLTKLNVLKCKKVQIWNTTGHIYNTAVPPSDTPM